MRYRRLLASHSTRERLLTPPHPSPDDISTHISPLADRKRTLSNSQASSHFSQASKGLNGHAVAPPSSTSAEPSELLALLQTAGPTLANVDALSNADLVRIQRLLARTMAVVTQEMQDRLLR